MGNLESVRYLLRHPDLNPNLATNYMVTPLHSAVKLGNQEIIRLLLTTPNLNLNSVDMDWQSALHWAVDFERYEIGVLLIRKGINPHIIDRNGRTAYDLAWTRFLEVWVRALRTAT